MARFGRKASRRDGGREDLRRQRVEKRVQDRLNAAEAKAEPKITLLRRAGWRIRETGWTLQERLLWPLSDWTLIALDAARWPFERAAWALREKLIWPLQDRLATASPAAGPVPRRTTLAVLGVIAAGALGTGAVVAASGGESGPATNPEPVVATATTPDPEPVPPPAETESAPEGPELKGVVPSFGAKSAAERRKARRLARKLAAKGGNDDAAVTPKAEVTDPEVPATKPDAEQVGTTGTGSEGEVLADAEPGSAGGATASNAELKKARRKESALSVAERFAMAFVSYEVGASGGPIEATFRDTADKDLFRSLTERPPRQPAGKKVPKARVVNVVGGPRKEKSMEVSVGLLRVDGLSELRLDMRRLERGWVVKTVRG